MIDNSLWWNIFFTGLTTSLYIGLMNLVTAIEKKRKSSKIAVCICIPIILICIIGLQTTNAAHWAAIDKDQAAKHCEHTCTCDCDIHFPCTREHSSRGYF